MAVQLTVQGQRSYGMRQSPCRGRNVDTELSDGLECSGGEQSGFHGVVDGTDAEQEPVGRLSGREFIKYINGAGSLTEMDTDFMLKTLDHIKIFEDGMLVVMFLDGTETECKNEEE